jgi:hypothetical protein
MAVTYCRWYGGRSVLQARRVPPERFGTAGVNTTSDTITVEPYLGLRVSDPVKFRVVNMQTGGTGTGTLPAPLSAATTYYVISYTAATGALQVATSAGGTALDLTTVGTAVAPNESEVVLRRLCRRRSGAVVVV